MSAEYDTACLLLGSSGPLINAILIFMFDYELKKYLSVGIDAVYASMPGSVKKLMERKRVSSSRVQLANLDRKQRDTDVKIEPHVLADTVILDRGAGIT